MLDWLKMKWSEEPALIIGAVIAGFNAYIALKGAGGLEDGFQFDPDGWAILIPILGALGIRSQVYSPKSAYELKAAAADPEAERKLTELKPEPKPTKKR